MAQNQMVCQFCETSTIIKWKCVNCDLILCEECKTRIHSKSQNLKEHETIDLKEFNTTSAVETIRILDLKNILCTNHASEKCIIYCQDCEMLLCSSCLIESHGNHKLGKIDNVYQQKLQELTDLEGKSNQQMKLFSETENKLDSALSKGRTQYNEIKQRIFEREAEIREAATQQSEQLVKELDKLWKPEENKITRELGEIKEKKGDLSQQLSHVEEAFLSHKAMTIFTACDTTSAIKKDIPTLPTHTESLDKDIILSKPSPKKPMVILGMLRTIPKPKVIKSYNSELTSILKVITTDDDINILCSNNNQIISKFELKGFKCLTTTVVENVDVIDMTLTKQGTLLFSVSSDSKVKCVKSFSSATMETFTSISPLHVRGIHATDKNILIGFCDNGKHFPLTKDSRRGIIIQDYNGRHIRTMERDTNNGRIFSSPEEITTNINGDICVVDSENSSWEGRVVVLSELGSVKWTYEGHSSINSNYKFTPYDLVTTNEGFILVADCNSNAIHILSIDADLLTSLTKKHGIEQPLCVNIDKSGKLMVGCSSFNTDDKIAKLHVVEIIV